MTRLFAATLVGLACAACVPTSNPGWLLAPADPRLGGRAAPPIDVTRGVTRFGVVAPKDWRALNRAVGSGERGSSMPGMDMGDKPGAGGR